MRCVAVSGSSFVGVCGRSGDCLAVREGLEVELETREEWIEEARMERTERTEGTNGHLHPLTSQEYPTRP